MPVNPILIAPVIDGYAYAQCPIDGLIVSGSNDVYIPEALRDRYPYRSAKWHDLRREMLDWPEPLVTNEDRADFATWISSFEGREIIGASGDGHGCPVALWLTTTERFRAYAGWMAVGRGVIMLGCKRAPLPEWARGVVWRVDWFTVGVVQRPFRTLIRAEWLRMMLAKSGDWPEFQPEAVAQSSVESVRYAAPYTREPVPFVAPFRKHHTQIVAGPAYQAVGSP